MKVGDLIRYRDDWTRDTNGDPVIPRTDNNGWSQPCLVLREWEEMWIILADGQEAVINPVEGLIGVEVISASA